MKVEKIRLPDDLIGDDGLVGVLAKADLENEAGWCEDRLAICGAAGFRCEPDYLRNPTTWRMQYKRMLTYSLCHFQNIIVSDIMKSSGQ